MSRPKRVAVLGAGIMGSSAALFLARRGHLVSLFDAAAAPFSAASRWNEGKIHLGFLYSGDASLGTARHLIAGGLQFKRLTEQLIGCAIDAAATAEDDLFLCHRLSVTPPEAMGRYFDRCAELVRQHPDAAGYLTDVSGGAARAMTPAQLAAVSGSPDIVAGFRAPERSVSTPWIADRFVAALAAEPRIEARMGTRIEAVRPASAGHVEGPWQVRTADGAREAFDIVINALWAGRLAIDVTAGLRPPDVWSNRYRLALFVRTRGPVALPCATIATGPFGDVKNYNDRAFYLSWYPQGLRVDSAALTPPEPAPLDEAAKQQLCGSMLDHLQALLPGVAAIRTHASQVTVQGGWVFAAGQGLLSDPGSSLHRRSDFRITRLGSYISVDTGKYSTAPWLAKQLADQIG